jgi:aminoglycoside/choline kinase family phosphotransferase
MREHSARLDLLHAWLKNQARLTDYRLTPASGDASFRRYFRATANGESYIIMDAPPDKEDCRPFIHVAALLRKAGLYAPDVLAQNLQQGFLLLTDLGAKTYLDVLSPAAVNGLHGSRMRVNEPQGEPAYEADALFDDAIDALIRWQLASKPNVLPPYDQCLLGRELNLFTNWYLGRHLGVSLDDESRALWRLTCERLIASALAQPSVYVHRDYMPRNLMVSVPNPGVLDFQDAVYGPITYDVVCLFKDAFLSWPEERVQAWAHGYWESARAVRLPVSDDVQAFKRALDWMGLQRHLKVLGIFARLTHRDGKTRYLDDTPRFVRYVMAVAPRYAELAPLTHLFERHVLPKVSV